MKADQVTVRTLIVMMRASEVGSRAHVLVASSEVGMLSSAVLVVICRGAHHRNGKHVGRIAAVSAEALTHTINAHR